MKPNPNRGRNYILFHIWLISFCVWWLSADIFYWKGTHPFGEVIHTLLVVAIFGIPLYGLIFYLRSAKSRKERIIK